MSNFNVDPMLYGSPERLSVISDEEACFQVKP